MNNYIVSARKYRPTTFDSVVGQQTLIRTLKNAIASHKLAHAYLFCGPRGVGKTTCARIFAKTINCLHPTAELEACNACESCLSFNEQRSYNIHELDAASNNSVDDIRDLIAQVQIPPQIGKYKIYIVDEVHMLSTQAFNAFLKTLEEPPRHAVFILATTEKHKILPTILSRCQVYDFNRITPQDTINHLKLVAQKEEVQYEETALHLIAQKADGGMRDALSIFDQLVSSTGSNLSYQQVVDNLNVLDYEYFFRMTQAALQGQVAQSLVILDETIRKGFDAQLFISGWASHLRDLLVSKDAATVSLLEVSSEIAQRYQQQAQHTPLNFLYKALEEANTCDLNYKGSKNKRLLVEITCIKIAQILSPDQPRHDQPTPLKPLQAQPAAATAPIQAPAVPVTPTPAPVASIQQAPSPSSRVVAQINPSTQNVLEQQEAYKTPAKTTKGSLKSFSLKKGFKTEEQSATNEKPVEMQQMHQPVNNELLESAWKEYMQTIQTETILFNTLRTSQPLLLNDHDFEICVDNPDQVNRLQEKGADILWFLRQKLSNSSLSMKIRQSNRTEREKYLSEPEKFKAMAQLNPALIKLRDTFGLDLA